MGTLNLSTRIHTFWKPQYTPQDLYSFTRTSCTKLTKKVRLMLKVHLVLWHDAYAFENLMTMTMATTNEGQF